MHTIDAVGTMSLDEYIVKNKEATYMLSVVGDTLVEFGMHDGDMVLVERGRIPKIGDLVIAWHGDSFRIRKYSIQNGQESLHAEAVVIAIIRKYV